jgi:hypothetical protein
LRNTDEDARNERVLAESGAIVAIRFVIFDAAGNVTKERPREMPPTRFLEVVELQNPARGSGPGARSTEAPGPRSKPGVRAVAVLS